MVTRNHLHGLTPEDEERMDRLGRRMDAVFARSDLYALRSIERAAKCAARRRGSR